MTATRAVIADCENKSGVSLCFHDTNRTKLISASPSAAQAQLLAGPYSKPDQFLSAA